MIGIHIDFLPSTMRWEWYNTPWIDILNIYLATILIIKSKNLLEEFVQTLIMIIVNVVELDNA